MPKATKAPVVLQIDDKQVVYVCFWIKEYAENQLLTARSEPGEPPFRCQLLTLHKEVKHPINQYGQELTEQWWNFRRISESDYHRHAMYQSQMKKRSVEQDQLF